MHACMYPCEWKNSKGLHFGDTSFRTSGCERVGTPAPPPSWALSVSRPQPPLAPAPASHANSMRSHPRLRMRAVDSSRHIQECTNIK
jgi:hypothetical protein